MFINCHLRHSCRKLRQRRGAVAESTDTSGGDPGDERLRACVCGRVYMSGRDNEKHVSRGAQSGPSSGREAGRGAGTEGSDEVSAYIQTGRIGKQKWKEETKKCRGAFHARSHLPDLGED